MKPREWTLFYSGLSGQGHIHSAKQTQDGEGDVYYDVIEKEYCDRAISLLRKLADKVQLYAEAGNIHNYCDGTSTEEFLGDIAEEAQQFLSYSEIPDSSKDESEGV